MATERSAPIDVRAASRAYGAKLASIASRAVGIVAYLAALPREGELGTVGLY